jgi:hypothetical protein
MFRYIKITAVVCMMFSSSAFAHGGGHGGGYGHGGGFEHHGHYGGGYGYGYNNPYYGGGYFPRPVIVAPQPYYVQPPVAYGYVQPMPFYGGYR